MRGLKMRAWDEERKVMYQWEELRIEKDSGEDKLSVVLFDDCEGSYFDDMRFLQFTGATDKNGIEVYEGDIVKIYPKEGYGHLTTESDIGVIEYVYTSYMIRGKAERAPYFLIYAETEVIGNIFQDKHLLVA